MVFAMLGKRILQQFFKTAFAPMVGCRPPSFCTSVHYLLLTQRGAREMPFWQCARSALIDNLVEDRAAG
jgi:hypothetical protein